MLTNTFAKAPNCPTSQEILSHVEGSLASFSENNLVRHIERCDFCGAEMQLFARYRPVEEDYTPAPMPAALHLLANSLPPARTSSMHQRAA